MQREKNGLTLDRLISRNLKAKHTWFLRLPVDMPLHGSAEDVRGCIRGILPTNQPIVEVTALGGAPITCTDLRMVAKEAHARNEVVVCDNTLATSFGCPATRLGADIVLEGLSHALGAAGDNLVAVSLSVEFLAAHPETAARLEAKRPDNALADDFADAYLRWDTVRKRQNDAALAIAEYLVCHPKVARVWYPGLLRDQRDSSQPDPTNAVAPAILTGGFGPVVDFELANSPVHDCVPDFAAESHLRLIGKRLIRLVCTEEEIIAHARAVEQELADI